MLVAIGSATTRADDVAKRISADVSASVVQDARESRIVTGRAELARANARLVARELPIVPDPGPGASGDQLLIQAARASVLADLPDAIVADLRREFAGRQVLPSALGQRPPSLGGDRIVTTLPISPAGPTLVELPPPSSAPSTGPGPTPPGSTGGATPAPSAPAAPDSTPRRGLLPLLPDLPIRVPLLSE